MSEQVLAEFGTGRVFQLSFDTGNVYCNLFCKRQYRVKFDPLFVNDSKICSFRRIGLLNFKVKAFERQ